MSNYDFCINLLKKMYKKDFMISKENKYEIFIRGISNNIETKYEIKKTLRNILSSNNKYIDKDIVSLIELKYKMNKEELKLLNEMYPNIDILISSYINNSDPIITIKEFNYGNLLEYFLKSTIEQLENENIKKEYIKLNEELNKKESRLNELRDKLEKFQIAQKNSFYYETYRDYLFNEMENYNEEKELILSEIELDEQKLNKLKKQYQKIDMLNQISKKTSVKRINKLNELFNNIEYLENKIKERKIELKNLEIKNKENIRRNNVAVKEYINMDINEYSLIYERNKTIDGKKIVDEIKNLEQQVKIIIEKINISEYPYIHRKLKYFLEENKKSFKKMTDLSPKTSLNIMNLLKKDY